MFKLLKWFVIILVVVSTWYVASFFMAMDESDQEKVKRDAVGAFETGVLSGPLADRIKADFLEKKAKFFDNLRDTLKGTVDNAIDGKMPRSLP